MPLKLCRRHNSPFYYVRGTVRGCRVDESTRLVDRKAAREWCALREAELVKQSVHGAASVKTFAHAAQSYLEEGGAPAHVGPVLEFFGTTKLANIDMDAISRAAKKLGKKRDGTRKSPATINRQVFTPVVAILNHAAGKGWCSKPWIKRPTPPDGRVRYATREEANRMIACAAEHLRPLVIFLFSTGARLSEALYLDWRHVDLEAGRVSFHGTKNGTSRGVPLHPRVIEELGRLPHRGGAVFRRPDGEPYAHRGGLGGGQVKTAWATMIKRARITDFHPHDCRHTWATWHYAENRDVLGLMTLGGWSTQKMVERYTHVNQDQLAPSILQIWGDSWGDGLATTKNLNELKDAA